MKKLLLIGLMLVTTSAVAWERYDAYGNRVSNVCNSILRPWSVLMPGPLPVGWSCLMPDATPGVVGG